MKRLLKIFSLAIIVSAGMLTIQNENQSTYDSNWPVEIVGIDTKESIEPLKIAILDSGINKDHREFDTIRFVEYNAITGKEDQVLDDFGHGTAIAGIIASKGEVIKGIVNSPILYDVKVLDKNGEGDIDSVINGINWSIKNKVDIINISFGFTSGDKRLEEVINKAYDEGILIIAASGNTMGLSVDYPANYKNVVSISSIDKELKIDPYSATGKVDFSAPGVDVLSTNMEGGYSIFSGTSFACAYATGVLSTIYKREKTKNLLEMKKIIHNYTVVIGSTEEYGRGLLTLKKEYVEELR